jgi:hypothetical protein
MRIWCRRRWVLWRLGRSVRRSDPHLAAMLSIFGRLSAGEAIDSGEQAGPFGDRVRGALGTRARGTPRRLRCAWIVVRWRFNVRRAMGFPPAAAPPRKPKSPS